MARPPRPETEREATPKSFAEVPPYRQAVDIGWLSESMMQMQKSLGELSANVQHLTTASNKQSTKLDRISHVLFAAAAVLAVVLTIGGFFIKDIWAGVLILMKAAH